MYDRIRGLSAPFLLTAFVLFYTSTAAIADDDNAVWHVSNAFGNVWVTVGGVQHASLSHSRILKPGDSMHTGQNGRALLVHGQEYILISPNSAIEIPRETKQGLMTTIIQTAGSIVLEVEKRNVKHFEVETPLLAALVKGTKFRITIEKNSSYVDVLRGEVEVSDFRSGQYALVEPGQTAKVFAEQSGLSLSGLGPLGFIQQGMPRRSSTDTEPLTHELGRRAAADSTQNERQIDKASSHREAQTIPSSLRKNAGAQSMQWRLSMNPVQGSRVPEDHLDPSGVASKERVRVGSLLNEGGSRDADVSDVAAPRRADDNNAPRRADDNNSDTSKTDESMHIVLIVCVGFIVSCAVGAVRRRKIERPD
jgi:hypothetical protein